MESRPDPKADQWDQRGAVWVSLPLLILGFFLVAFALFNAAWPPDYLNADSGQHVSHLDRMLGKDQPIFNGTKVEVERPPAYLARRIVDAVAYISVIIGVLLLLGLAWWGERVFYLPLMVIGLYGLCYSVGLGIVIGPTVAAAGYTPIFLGAVIGWLMTDLPKHQNQENQQMTGIGFTG
ncbi:MAG: hypothetical protein HY862_14570 [Chloroflexi bacterium]|nr:hypothetical protein [Chloroflexota bacterium]